MMLMMAKKINHTDPFAAALDHYIRVRRLTNDELGGMVGYSGAMIDAIRHERSAGIEPKRREIAKHLGFEYEVFIREGEAMVGQSSSVETGSQIISITDKHKDLIDMFENKPLALEINQILLQIERQDPEKLRLAKRLISTLVVDHSAKSQKKRG